MTTPAEKLAIYSSQSQLSSFFTNKVGIFSILSYADGEDIYDGVTIATTALTDTITAAAVEGGIVLIPTTENGSTYLIDDDVTIPSNVTLWNIPGAILKGSLGTEILTLNCGMNEDLFKKFDNILIDGTIKTQKVFPEWWGALGDGTTNDTDSFDSMFSSFTTGVNVDLQQRVYVLDDLSNFFKVKMQGKGMGKTILKQSVTSTATDFMNYDTYSVGCNLKDLTLLGNGVTATNGLRYQETEGSDTIDFDTMYDNTITKIDEADNSYKWNQFENIFITGFNGSGLYLDRTNYMSKFSFIHSYANNIGITNKSYDNFFSDMYVERNGYGGIVEEGVNNKWVSLKINWNGKEDGDSSGLVVSGRRNIFLGVESQDNYTHGFDITGNYNIFSACMSDSNGYNGNDTPISKYGFRVSGSYNKFPGSSVINYKDYLDNSTFLEKGVLVLDAGIGNDTDEIKIIEGSSKTNNIKQYTKAQRNSDLVFTTIAGGALTIDATGLVPQSTEDIIIPKNFGGGFINGIIDFKMLIDKTALGADTATNFRLLVGNRDGSNDDFGILYRVVKVAGVVTDEYIQFSINTLDGETIFNIHRYTFTLNESYRFYFSSNIRDVGKITTSISYLSATEGCVIDTDYESNAITNTYSVLTPIQDLLIPNNAIYGTHFTCSIEKILITSKYMPSQNRLYGEDLEGLAHDAEVWCDFWNYKPDNVYTYGSQQKPDAIEFYRGHELYLTASSTTDKEIQCIKDRADAYVFVEKVVSLTDGSVIYNPPSLIDGAGVTTTVTVTGAELGDFAVASFSNAQADVIINAWVSASDTVSVRFQNESTGTVDLASGTLRAKVIKA